LKVEYVNPFITATLTTFSTVLQINLTAGKPQIKMDNFPSYDISGIIGISGDASGLIALSYPKLVALKAVSKMIGSEIKIIGPDVTDAIGELTNIIAGSAKKDLKNLNVSISLPNVIVGKDHVLASPRDVQSIVVPFTSEIGNIALEVSLRTA
jgi:chemotaxis protein CheX